MASPARQLSQQRAAFGASDGRRATHESDGYIDLEASHPGPQHDPFAQRSSAGNFTGPPPPRVHAPREAPTRQQAARPAPEPVRDDDAYAETSYASHPAYQPPAPLEPPYEPSYASAAEASSAGQDPWTTGPPQRRASRDRLAGGRALAWSARSDASHARAEQERRHYRDDRGRDGGRDGDDGQPGEGRSLHRRETSIIPDEGRRKGASSLARAFGWVLTLGVLVAILIGAAYLAKRMGLLDSLSSGSGSGSASGSGTSKAAAKPRTTGKVRVASTPAGASVEICGQSSGGKTPAVLEILAPRECEVVLRLRGYKVFRAKVSIVANKVSAVDATLLRRKRGKRWRAKAKGALTDKDKPSGGSGSDRDVPKGDPVAAAAAIGRGLLVVTSIEVGTVSVNGIRLGSTPKVSRALRPGLYDVRVHFKQRGVHTRPRRVRVVVGKAVRLHIDPGS
ncbi:MAG: PEGA domain-containing protein [Myxococcales bacterium]|nr:PEGA domain-containing protein [Myxococcales bacterium]